MAKRRRYSFPRRRRRSFRPYHKAKRKIPLAPMIGLAATIISAKHPYASAGDTMSGKLIAGDFKGAMADIPGAFMGVTNDGKFHLDTVVATWTPLIAGVLIHKFVGGRPLNVNSAIKNVPYINI